MQNTGLGGLGGDHLLYLIYQAGWIVQLVLLLLIVSSVVCWSIIAFKTFELRRAHRDTEDFLEIYFERSLQSAYQMAREHASSPLVAVFLESHVELERMGRYREGAGSGGDEAAQHRNFQHVVAWLAQREGQRLERGLPFLATTGSAAPFVGLFGTVVGIIDAFQSIGASGSASLAVVAPGIAEALIATAMGLAAAIPATVAYNHFLSRLRSLQASNALFATQLGTDLWDRMGRVARDRRAPRVEIVALPPSAPPGSGGGTTGSLLSEINVTPFVDVMLVLLVIFMVTAPLMQHGINVDLPETSTEGLRLPKEPLVLSVREDGATFIGRTEVPTEELEEKLRAIFASRGEESLYLRADREAPYGQVVQAMGAARRAGALRLGIVTEPEG